MTVTSLFQVVNCLELDMHYTVGQQNLYLILMVHSHNSTFNIVLNTCDFVTNFKKCINNSKFCS